MTVIRQLGPGAWSYFGDPRAIAHDGVIFTGWISRRGDVWVARLGARGSVERHRLFRGLGRDDHNNPSLVFLRDGRLAAFFSPHSGHSSPPPGIPSVMRYRVSAEPYSIEAWGPVLTVPNVPGPLGFTYPNPIQLRDRLWLFWRGAGWNPTFSSSADGVGWAPACELVRTPPRERPYAKYVGDGERTIHGILSDGHVSEAACSLRYFRCSADELLAWTPGDGFARLDVVYAYSEDGGSAWPHDIALTADGRPRVVYTRRAEDGDGEDTFWYAHHDGERWVSSRIVGAGAGRRTFRSGGASLDHDDPRSVFLSRTIGAWNQVEHWFTPDEGRSWTTRQLTDDAKHYAVRPVKPRGLEGANQVLYSRGNRRTRGYTRYRTQICVLEF